MAYPLDQVPILMGKNLKLLDEVLLVCTDMPRNGITSCCEEPKSRDSEILVEKRS
jgi:hypothetical protein